MYEAARIHDPIAHSSALAGFLVGALIGIAIIAAVAFLTVATGGCGTAFFIAALVAGFAADSLANSVLSLGESIGRSIKSKAGMIAAGSSNVFVNDREAARVEFSTVACEKHPPVKRIAEGSSNVFINDKAAARRDDRTECDATIDGGSDNVYIGGGRQQYLKIDPEIPDWLRTTVQVAFVVAGLVGGLAGAARQAEVLGARFGVRCATKFAAVFGLGVLASEVVNRYVIGPALSGLMGHPVEMTSGRKLILPESDFVLPGRLPIGCSRFYSSTLSGAGLLGPGWRLDWEMSLQRSEGELVYRGPQGRPIHFPSMEPGHQLYDAEEQIYLSRVHDGRYIVHTLTGHYFVFGEFDRHDLARLTLIEGPQGQQVFLNWDEYGTLHDIKDQAGHWLRLHYGGAFARLSHIELLAGGTPGVLVRYGYDDHGYLNSVTDRAGTVTRRFAYEEGLMVRQRNAEGFECEYRWAHTQDRACVVEHRTSAGEHYRFRYDFEHGQSEATDVFGNVARWQFDANQRVTAHTGFDGLSYRFEYDPSGWPSVMHLPGERTVELRYDELGRLVAETDPLGQTTRFEYHASTASVRETVLHDGRKWRTDYDDRNRPVLEIDPLGRRTTLAYGRDGQLSHITDARGGTVSLEHDERGLLSARTDCSGSVTRYTYDADSRLIALTDALNQTTRVRYNASGLPEAVTRGDLQIERYRWNALGQLIEHVRPAGQTERWTRDSLGRVSTYTDAEGRTIRYERDAYGRPLKLINGNGASYAFDWDAAGRLMREQRVDGTSRSFAYGDDGFLRYVVTRAGDSERMELHERDALGRLIQRAGEHSQTRYRYDVLGQLTEARRIPTNAGELLDIVADTVRRDYDAAGQLLAEHGVNGSVRYERDELGNPLSMTLPDAQRIETLYYGSGHAHRISVDGEVIADFERNALHAEIVRSQGALSLHTGYTPLGQVAWQRASKTPIQQHAATEADSALWWRYNYDSRGEMVESIDRQHGRTVYDYDRAGQLLRRSAEGFDEERFTWDAAGNLLNDEGRVANEKIAPLLDNLLREYHGVRYEYDEWGQLVRRNSMALGWDAEGHLLWTDDGVVRASYRYDALGRRIEKRVRAVAANGFSEKRVWFIWDNLRLAQEREDTGSIRTYLYDPVRAYAPLARLDRAYATDQAKVYHYHTDPAGTAREVTDAQGRVVWSGGYAAWGKVRANLASSAQPFIQSLRMPGQYHDDESGLHYNTFRYYDAHAGRFISSDPIGLAGGFNLYQYAPNPIRWIDPWGLANLDHESDFDAARRAAFEKAGMTNPENVSFSKFDPETGTIVEFKGPGGAKVAYDGPHADMDAAVGHDKPHVGWQTEGKRGAGGAERGNVTYDGEQHPHRSDIKGAGDLC
ncbi:polymorphic toxin type 47 domain-containing protein [Caballeronia sp. NK8]|uniref:polymorphic toxin type 47 domain-containing protein n=1 Tax=Caballeronia sp. NK8 TaxID=140098 RepID=UPI001BCAC55E|nr:polymorphic toxin type 47 domain-containing protein [Caballeronia sp. NK8]